jgi:hypothetical protein
MAQFSEGGQEDLLARAEGCGFATPSPAGGCQDFDKPWEKRPKSTRLQRRAARILASPPSAKDAEEWGTHIFV